MKTYIVNYWTFDNWDGDPDSMIFQSETPPTREMIEEKIWSDVQSFNFREVELVDAD